MKPKVIADAAIPFLNGALDGYADITFKKGSEITPSDVRFADALFVRTRTKCNEELLDGSNVKLVATATIGHDHIDIGYCKDSGIEVATAAGCNARGVLQYVMSALAGLSEKDGWTPQEKTLGVIGVGNVGSLVAGYAKHFGFNVLCCDPPKQNTNPSLNYLPLEAMLPQCDIITVHVPLTREGEYKTLGMADNSFFENMPQGAVFINSSRGEVVSDEALIAALKRGHISRTVIDTWNHEPAINPELLNLAAYATPHIAGYSLQGKAAGTAAVVRALGRRFGLPLDNWYPSEVTPVKPDPDITWDKLLKTVRSYHDIEKETARLKAEPQLFEQYREKYDYRTEYF